MDDVAACDPIYSPSSEGLFAGWRCSLLSHPVHNLSKDLPSDSPSRRDKDAPILAEPSQGFSMSGYLWQDGEDVDVVAVERVVKFKVHFSFLWVVRPRSWHLPLLSVFEIRPAQAAFGRLFHGLTKIRRAAPRATEWPHRNSGACHVP